MVYKSEKWERGNWGGGGDLGSEARRKTLSQELRWFSSSVMSLRDCRGGWELEGEGALGEGGREGVLGEGGRNEETKEEEEREKWREVKERGRTRLVSR